MNNTVVILQPSYLPWLGYFDQINRSKSFVFFDDVQYTRRDWRNRNYIKTRSGEKRFLTVPVETKGKYNSLIKDITISKNSPWQREHCALMNEHYKQALFFKDFFPGIEECINFPWDTLSSLNIALTKRIAEHLGISHVNFFISSELPIGPYENSTEHLIKICNYLDADTYLTGGSAKEYLEEEQFQNAGIALEYQQYSHPVYRQLWGEFIPYLSIVDLICNEGPNSLSILSSKKTVS